MEIEGPPINGPLHFRGEPMWFEGTKQKSQKCKIKKLKQDNNRIKDHNYPNCSPCKLHSIKIHVNFVTAYFVIQIL